MNEPRAICAGCGHVRSWHDRDSARAMRSGELASDRRCYREVGGASCRCSGFRDSGEVAVAAGGAAPSRRAAPLALLAFLLVVMGVALLYAYRSQTPSVATIPMSQAIQEVNSGQVKKVTIVANTARIELVSGEQQQANLPPRDEVFQKALSEYNTANPSRSIIIDYQQ